MEENRQYEWGDLIAAIASAIDRTEAAIPKFSPGSSQFSLLDHRLQALRMAGFVLSKEAGVIPPSDGSKEDLIKAVGPLTSLLHKSEKAWPKLIPTTWQAAMLDRLIIAIRTSLSLVAKSLDGH